MCLAIGLGWAGGAEAGTVTTLHELLSLHRDEALSGQPVRIQGVVLCYDADWRQLFIHDGEETTYFDAHLFQEQPTAGQSVLMTGRTTFENGKGWLTNSAMTIVGPGRIPPAKRVELGQLGSVLGQWIETSGRVRVAETSRGRLSLVLRDKTFESQVSVLGPSGTNDPGGLLDCLVRIRGISIAQTDSGRPDLGSVTAAGFNEIEVLDRPRESPLGSPVITIGGLLNRELGPWTNNRVHLNATVVSYEPGHWLAVRDPTGFLRAQITQVTEVEANERVDLWGFLNILPTEVVLTDGYFAVAGAPSAIAQRVPPGPASSAGATARGPLTQVSDILRLGSQEAARHLRVHLRAVVTYADPEWRNGFIQDATGGIYVDLAQPEVRAGQWVEVEGQTDPGGFAPQLIRVSLRILGTTNLPLGIKVDLDSLANGTLDAQWVQIDGIIRQLKQQEKHLHLTLMTPKGELKVIVPAVTNELLSANLLGALVQVDGACVSEFNSRRQVVGITLSVPSLDQIRIVEPGDANPWAVRTALIREVGTYDSTRLVGRRVKVEGVVSLIIPGQGFFIQDGSGGIDVRYGQPSELHIGDVVEVLGFPGLGDVAPHLEQSVFRRVAGGPRLVPRRATATEVMLNSGSDHVLVSIEGRLLQDAARSASPELILQDGPVVFTARLQTPAQNRRRADLRAGSRLRLAGLCLLKSNERHEIESFRILVPDIRSIEVIEAPPWWTSRHTIQAVLGLGFLILLAAAWVALLRSRLREQTRLIRQQLMTEAALESRYRELIDSANDAILSADTETGQILSANRKAAELLGLPAEKLVGRNFLDIIPPEDRERQFELLKSQVQAGRATYDGFLFCLGDGRRIPVEVSANVTEVNGRPVSQSIFRDLTERKQAEEGLALAQKRLLESSRAAGMAEVATSVLHNVGNVLNSVNVSATVISDRLRKSRLSILNQVVGGLREHEGDLADFLTRDAKGQRFPSLLSHLNDNLRSEQSALLQEAESLRKNIDHIKEIVAMQQGYAKVAGVTERVKVIDLVEDALRLNAESLVRHQVQVRHECDPEVPVITVDKHKVIQILVNLVRNAKHACEDSGRVNKELTLLVSSGKGQVKISVADNGVGIPRESLTRIFSFGFTTRKNGHGFGLHSGALAAKELGGSLVAFSEGPGCGAIFTLDLPLEPPPCGL